MLYIVIAVIVLLAALNVFMLLILKQMAAATGKQIEKDAGRLFGAYDALLEKKSEQLAALRREEAALKEQMQAARLAEARRKKSESAPVTVKPQTEQAAAGYQDGGFSGTYRKIKEEFDFSKEALYERFCGKLPAPSEAEEARLSVIRRIRGGLQFETVYRLSLMSSEQQRTILKDVLDEDERIIYDDWAYSAPDGDAAGFAAYLDAELKRLSDEVVLRTPENDPSICEGAKILYRGKLYDYSI